MRITGSVTVPQPVDRVWEAILDPAVLVRAIPGCSRLEVTGENAYAMTVTAGVAAITGSYDGTAVLSDLVPGESLVMRLTGAGAPGTVEATVAVSFTPVDGGTEVCYDAEAVVGGMVGGVGQRMLASVAKRMAGQFFANLGEAVAGPEVSSPADAAGRVASASERIGAGAPVGELFTRPVPTPATSGDFTKGIAVGAGLVLLGVVAGRLLGRR